MNVILYTIGCSKCYVLKEKLEAKNIAFDIVDDEDTLRDLGFDKFPKLSVDGKIMEYTDAVKWVELQ